MWCFFSPFISYFMSSASVITVRPSRIVRGLLLVMLSLAFYALLMLISWRYEATRWLMGLWLLVLLFVLFWVARIWIGQVTERLMIVGGSELIYLGTDSQPGAENAIRLMRIEDCVVWNMLVAFRAFDDDGSSRQFLILFDSVSKEEFRRLKVFLRWR